MKSNMEQSHRPKPLSLNFILTSQPETRQLPTLPELEYHQSVTTSSGGVPLTPIRELFSDILSSPLFPSQRLASTPTYRISHNEAGEGSNVHEFVANRRYYPSAVPLQNSGGQFNSPPKVTAVGSPEYDAMVYYSAHEQETRDKHHHEINDDPCSMMCARPRKRYHQVERFYPCNFPGCDKSYGALSHLNTHIAFKGHGPKRKPQEFAVLRDALRKRDQLINPSHFLPQPNHRYATNDQHYHYQDTQPNST